MAINVPIVSQFVPTGIDKATREFKKLETTSQKVGFALKKAFLPAAAALAGVTAAAGKFVIAGERAATSNARIDQITKSMGLAGAASGELSKKLIEMANAQALASGEDQNAIKLGMAKLLTFSEIAKSAGEMGGIFERTTKVSLDLAAAGFGTVSDNATQLGKALQDPVKGLNALTRSGVTFTAAEKNLIQTLVQSGRTLEAQEMILKAIEGQVGGTAAATRNATDRMKVSFSLLSEEIGLALIPVLDKLIPLVTRFVKFAIDNKHVIIGLGVAVAAFASAIVVANVAMKAWNAIALITKGINMILGTSFTALWVATGVGIVIALIAVIVTLQIKFNILGKAVDGVKVAVKFLWEAAKIALGQIIDIINKLIDTWNKLPLVPDIERIDDAFLGLGKTTDNTAGKLDNAAAVAAHTAYEMAELRRHTGLAEQQMAQALIPTVEKVGVSFNKATFELDAFYGRLDRKEGMEKFNAELDAIQEELSRLTPGTAEFIAKFEEGQRLVGKLSDEIKRIPAALELNLQLRGDLELLQRVLNLSSMNDTYRATGQDEQRFLSAGAFAAGTTININMPAGSNGRDVIDEINRETRRTGSTTFANSGAIRR